ncbi:hypothetical protein SEA_ZOOMAN_195 [Microbacterium phage Zooman]|nr:hypothetical protein SEA_ZOOMAN_195 [Microbacterium phage Zooman]
MSVTITGPEGAEKIVFTQEESEQAWALIQRFAWKAAAINDQRRLDNS